MKLGYSREANRGGLRLIPYFTLSVRDSRLNDYYYGVMVSEATADRPAYGAGGGVNGTLWPHYPAMTKPSDAASDHAAVFADINL